MSLTKLKNGKYMVRVNIAITKGVYKRINKTVSSYEEAKALDKKYSDLKNNKEQTTFSDFYEIYKKDHTGRYSPTSNVILDCVVKKYILPYFSNYSLCEITPSSIYSWQCKMASLNISSSTLLSYETIFQQMMDFAVKFYNLKQNPFSQTGKIGKRSPTEMNFWTIDEFKKVLSVLPIQSTTDEAFRVILLISFFCGTRIGETLALTRDDVDFKKNTLHITKTYKKINSTEYISKPKTKTSIRNIVMPKFLGQIMAIYISKVPIEENRIFYLISRHMIMKRIHKYAEIARVKDIRIHDLRHSAISYLIHLGVPIYDISRRAGHISPKITYKVYSHLYPDQKSHIADVMEKAHNECKANGEDF